MVWVTSQVTVVCCRQLDLPGMDTAAARAPKMGKGGFKLFVPDMEQKLVISREGGYTLQMVS